MVTRNRVHEQSLGTSLKMARRDRGFTQGELAAKAGLHRNAVSAIEAGRGRFETLFLLADALGLEVTGRGLARDGTLGERMQALRKRRRLSRRNAATLAGISVPAIESVEQTGTSHVVSIEALGHAIGAGLCLRQKGTAFGFWESTAISSADDEWYTPPWLLDRLYRVIGGSFGLDPCSPVRRGPRTTVRARVRYVAQDDSLNLPWKAATVFVNPPYGRQLRAWVAKAHNEANTRRAGVVFGLVPARCDTGWWHSHVAEAADIWMLRGRLSFGDGSKPAPFPSAIVAWSATDEHRKRMAVEFPDAWHVPCDRPGQKVELAAD
jgi:phage N-6-adenine-methyltransferase